MGEYIATNYQYIGSEENIHFIKTEKGTVCMLNHTAKLVLENICNKTEKELEMLIKEHCVDIKASDNLCADINQCIKELIFGGLIITERGYCN